MGEHINVSSCDFMGSNQRPTVVSSDESKRPTAVVSWAHDTDAWQETVLEFATALRVVGGVDVDLDLWHLTDHENWTTFGPTAIRDSEFILIAISAAYGRAWEGTNTRGKNAGAALEAAAIKVIHEIDHREFSRRVMVILLPGAGVNDIPPDLRGIAERFEVSAFDEHGLEALLRSIYGKPLHQRPSLGPLPDLPPRFIADVLAEGDGRDANAADRTPVEHDPQDIDVLARRLTQLTEEIASISSAETDRDRAPSPSQDELQRLRSTIQASFDALQRVHALQRVVTPGVTRQAMLADYLDAQLYLSAGAHKAADECLDKVLGGLPASGPSASGLALEPCLRQLTPLVAQLNATMRDGRYRAVRGPRHPRPPAEAILETKHRKRIRDFYEVARCAMNEPESAEPEHTEPEPTEALAVIREAILHGRTPEESHATRLYARYTQRQRIATTPLGLRPPTEEGLESAAADWLAESGLDLHDGALASVVISALAEAHLLVHLVEHHRSGPVGDILDSSSGNASRDSAHLRRSIMLNTWVLAIGESIPWIFSANEQERSHIQRDAERARATLDPVAPMWLARQVTLLSLYRRSHGFRLLGDHERAYNDLRMLQRIGRLTRSVREDDDRVTGWLDTLKALAEYRIGELYRADHDYMQALVQLCRSHDSVLELRNSSQPAIAAELGHLEVKLSLGKGKAFFDIGAMKRSLKWHLTAWREMLDLQGPSADREPTQACIEVMETYLDRVKHDLELDKSETESRLAAVMERVCTCKVEERHHALAADILVRISHLLMVLRLPEDEPGSVLAGESSALRCMKRAAELDDRNLLVHTGLLRYEIRRPGLIATRPAHPVLDCWPSGASDVDQLIRAGEHLTLARLLAASRQEGDGKVEVARHLVNHFMTHTDSINLRGAILHRYLMRPRAEDREPWWHPSGPAKRKVVAPVSSGSSEPYLEFVCLRRFGSFTPFMPRPAAVSAVGGGYLMRICRPKAVHDKATAGRKVPDESDAKALHVFNIVIDPGEGTVNNLYGAGLSIADIDMVIATHDHPDHLSALDSIISLRKERRKAQTVAACSPESPDDEDRLLILGNRSVVNRYSFLNGDGKHLVQHIADAAALGGTGIPPDITIKALNTQHQDLGGHHAAAFVISLTTEATDSGDYQASEGGDRDASGIPHLPLTITFMADTAIDGLHTDNKRSEPIAPDWLAAMKSDIVVAHVSDVPGNELREIAAFPAEEPDGEISDFVRKVAELADQRPEDASQLMHALPLSPTHANGTGWPVPVSSHDDTEDGAQLYLSGVLEVSEHMRDASPPLASGARVLIIGELKEQLGSFRRTIAGEINERIFKGAPARLVALTADIGLRIRVGKPAADSCDRNTVLCSSCSFNNDRLDLERFHPPAHIKEVCVKGDHEAIFWNCELHDPGARTPPLFVEQMGGYNPFAAGGRYHG